MYQDFSMIYFFATSSGALSEKKEPLRINILKKKSD